MVKQVTLEEECREYTPDADLEGSGEKELGHNLAERMIQKYGGIENIPSYKDNFKPSNKSEDYIRKPIKEIILSSPEVVGRSPNVNFLVKADIKELGKEGYPIKKGIGKMNHTELWAYYLTVLKENDYFKQE